MTPEDVPALLARIVRRLDAIGAHDEALAEYVEPRRRMLVTLPPKLVPFARGWRLGAVLLDRDGVLSRSGGITRAIDPPRSNKQSLGAEERHHLRRIAARGDFAVGDVVNFDIEVIPTDAATIRAGTHALSVRDDTVWLTWVPGSSAPLERYLTERLDLLEHPE